MVRPRTLHSSSGLFLVLSWTQLERIARRACKKTLQRPGADLSLATNVAFTVSAHLDCRLLSGLTELSFRAQS